MHSSAPVPDGVIALDKNESAAELSTDEVAMIFCFLPYTDIMRARVCASWREAAKKTLVPLSDFDVDSVSSFNAMRVMSTALPNLQQISIHPLGPGQRFINGEDPDEEGAAETANYAAHDINIVSNFRKLREMRIYCADEAPLNGRYPVLFNFPLLRVLSIQDLGYLKIDLEMLEGLPSLEEFDCTCRSLTGNLNSLRVVRDTLEKVRIASGNISDNFMDLADFPRLRELNLILTDVTGDIRNIGRGDFPALESIVLPDTVAGGVDYELQHISEVPSFMHAIHLLLQRNSMMFHKERLSTGFNWELTEGSPDWYEPFAHGPDPPFRVQIIQVGKRLGWSWCIQNHSCEINWLDPVPSERDDYEAYMEDLQHIEQQTDFRLYRGYYQPPNEEEYHRLCLDHFLNELLETPFHEIMSMSNI